MRRKFSADLVLLLTLEPPEKDLSSSGTEGESRAALYTESEERGKPIHPQITQISQMFLVHENREVYGKSTPGIPLN